MGYANTVIAIKTFTPSDNILISNDAVKAVPSSGVWVKVKEITLSSTIGSASLFRFYFEAAETGGGTNRAQIYRNEVAVGTDSGEIPGGGGYTAYTENIVTTNFVLGDRIQLYGKSNALGCSVRNFRMKGDGSEWESTVV